MRDDPEIRRTGPRSIRKEAWMFMKLLVKRLTLAVLIVLPGIAQEPFGPARGGT